MALVCICLGAVPHFFDKKAATRFSREPVAIKPQADERFYEGNFQPTAIVQLKRPVVSILYAGDAENDVEMLGLAGIGVCVGNASPPARAAARFVALTNVENGSAVAMEQLLSTKSAGV